MHIKLSAHGWLELANKTGLKFTDMMTTAAALEEIEATAEASRRSSPAEKEQITTYCDALDGHTALAELTPLDIVKGAGVAKKQGTMGFARRELNRLVLTYSGTPKPVA